MKYNIVKIQQSPTGSVHCDTHRINNVIKVFSCKIEAQLRAKTLREEDPDLRCIVSKYWR